jgi:hypothetical protein
MGSPGKIFIHQRVLARLRAEYLEMPGMKLTTTQVQRLCGIEQTMCTLLLDVLVESQFLTRKSDGTYVRLTEGRPPLPSPANAGLKPVLPLTTSRCAS